MADPIHDQAEDGFHEIQLSGKQLVFLFMLTTVVLVVTFLSGVLVGRAVGTEDPAPDETTIATEQGSASPDLTEPTPSQPLEAHNGLQAEEKASDLQPDAIVTDLGLPGIDGYELCRRLHRSERLGRIPIVAITGRFLSPPDIERAKREGCQTVLIKPFVTDDLVAELRKALNAG